MNPVTSICGALRGPCVALDAPIEAWLTGGPYKWSFHSFWSVNDVIDVFTGLWDQIQQTKSWEPCGLTTPMVRSGAHVTPKLKEKGYKVVDVGRFPYGMQDYSAFINTWKKGVYRLSRADDSARLGHLLEAVPPARFYSQGGDHRKGHSLSRQTSRPSAETFQRLDLRNLVESRPSLQVLALRQDLQTALRRVDGEDQKTLDTADRF